MEPPPGVSLFAWIKQQLKDSIARGEFTPDEPFITQREIVERFGVSSTTAVRALNELVTEGVVVRRRGRGTFVVPRPTSGTRARTGTVVYVSPDAGSGHEAVLLAGLGVECGELGRRVVVEHTADVEHEAQVLARLGEAGGVDGIVLFPREHSVAAAPVEDLRRAGIAVVLVDRYLVHCPTDVVLFDDDAVGFGVTAAMIARGHTGMVVLWSETEVTSVRDRLAGHRRALREHGLPEFPDRWSLRSHTAPGSAERRERLRSLLVDAAAPTALICGNAPTLALVVADLLAIDPGLAGTVELASMDQSPAIDPRIDEVVPPAVAAARLPTRMMGREAARLVVARIDGDVSPARHVVLPVPVQVADRDRLIIPGHRSSP